MLTAQEIYTAARTLSLPERLRLAALILDELGSPPSNRLNGLAGYSDVWSDEDINDLRRFSANYLHSTENMATSDYDDALPAPEELRKMQAEQSLEPNPI